MSTINQYPNRFHGKVAVVTGAGSTAVGEVVGIGRAIATQLAREGARVALVDLNLGRAQETLEAIEAEGGEAMIVEGDVSSEKDCFNLYAEVKKQFGYASILVNNAGVTHGGGKLEGLDTEVWDRVLAINLTGAMHMAKFAIPHFRESDSGAIVNISSIGGLVASGAGVCYASSKAGMIAMSKELALLYGREGFRSNVVAPGHMYTPMAINAFTDEVRKKRQNVSPLKIEGSAWDIAKATTFLASDEARFITGVCLPVDGGVTTLGAFAAYGLINEE